MKKKLLIYAQYYAPDMVSTGQILRDQAEGMLDAFDVTVICVIPSYTGTIAPEYTTQKYYFEELNGVKLIRVRVPEFSKSNKVSRIKNIIAYFFGALGASKRAGEQDYVFAISQPPILGGILGVFGKWQKQAKMIYCIQDFNPEQIEAVGYFKNKMVLSGMRWLDIRTCRKSDLIVTVGRDLIGTINKRFIGKEVPKYTMINNWIDEKLIYPLPSSNQGVTAFKRRYGIENKFIIMYSGNIGLYYDLENIVKVAGIFCDATASDGRKVAFAFVGAGAVLNQLKAYREEYGLENIVFIPYQNKDDLIYSLNAADVHLCVNAKGLKGVSCPSKFYGIAACGKPVLGVLESGTEIRMLIEEINNGLVSEPGDYKSLEQNIRAFLDMAGSEKIVQMGLRGREYLGQYLTKDMSIRKYIEAINAL